MAMDKIKVGIIGLGCRGLANLKVILNIPKVSVVAVCDVYEDRCQQAVDSVVEKSGVTPFSTTDYKELLALDEIQAIMVFSSWETHIGVSIDAMNAGKAVAMEVGGAYNLEECFELVKTQEETKMPFMFLENCCYNKDELLALNMIRDGLLGEIVNCHGAYAHDLRIEVTGGKENRHYRLNNYINRNCENYPTHELGPIAKILDINRGNRMVSLVSVASKSAGLKQYINDRKDTIVNKDLIGQEFKQGDIVNTIISCENGETISLRLDTTLPRSYSREFTVHGTKGMYEAATNTVFLDGDTEEFDTLKFYKENIDNAKKYEEKYLPEYWKDVTEEIINSGHGGMDYFLFNDFFNRLAENLEMPLDVYDAAAWMCITCLSEISIKNGGAPVEIPDFTNGAYKNRKRFDV